MKKVVRQVSILKSTNRASFCALPRFYSTQHRNEQNTEEEERVVKLVPKTKQVSESSVDVASTTEQVQSQSVSNASKRVLTLTQNSEDLDQVRERSFNGYIQPRHYKLNEPQLVTEFSNELEKIAAPILGIEPPVISLEMGTNKIKFNILKASIKHFGREIPISELPRLRTIHDVAAFFAKQVIAEVPPPTFRIPNNLSLFIKSHAKKREIMVREEMVNLIGKRKRMSAMRQIKNYFPGPTPILSDRDVDFYLGVFRRNVDDKIFKKKLIKRHNPRKLYDTRIDYDRPLSSETEEVFQKKVEGQV